MLKKTIAHVLPAEFKGKNVLVRVDFNVPQNEDLSIADDSRIKASLETINYLRQAGAKVILVSHLGRPKGPSTKHSLAPVAARLSQLLGEPVKLLPGCVGKEIVEMVQALQNGEVCLLENVRFHPEEEKNDPEFAKALTSGVDIYVNDAFGTAHRAHASTCGVSKYVKTSLSGLLLHKEVKALTEILHSPPRPFATVIGGSKVSTKIGVLKNLLAKVDVLVIGGAMAFTFLKAQGKPVGKSLVEDDKLELCGELIKDFAAKGVRLILPEDLVCAAELKSGIVSTVYRADLIPSGEMGLDLGPASIATLRQELAKCRSILWNGPLGAFEFAGFEKATYALIDLLVELTGKGVKTVIGGGDSVAALEAHGVNPDSFTHVSTGGGAALEFMEGLELPGVACLDSLEGVSSTI